ncbi:MAG: trehalose-phosphatase [Dehalococcoidales bacterium]|nr:trehalose-phosphatase [Dehalococcoidales bacterium]
MVNVFNNINLVRENLKRVPFGLITDVDGTISQIAPTPQQAVVSPLCRKYLAELCNQIALVAVISGRQVTKTRDMLGIKGMIYVGNHGMERFNDRYVNLLPDTQDYPSIIKATIEEIAPFLSMENIIIENKGAVASIHYRLCYDHHLAQEHILTVLNYSPHAKNLWIRQEKMAIELLPPVDVNKGTAILSLIREYGLKGGIYMGDDITDIDAFKAIHSAGYDFDFQGYAIAIISSETPETVTQEADFTLKGVDDVERFLKWFSNTVREQG